MVILLIILLTICGLGIILCFYMLYRNEQVYNVRQYFNWKTDDYDYLPSYNEMMYSFTPMNKTYWLKWVEEQK